MAKKHIPFIVDLQQASSSQRKPAAPKKRRGPRQPLFTIEAAFSHLSSFKYEIDNDPKTEGDLAERHFAVERGIRAVAYVLASTTHGGNEGLSGQIALGLAHTLEVYASEIDALERARRLRAATRTSE